MSQRFRALVCHDGLFDMREMGDATEELWFSEHDPMLIIHGGLDYRVPETQGIGAFTVLQRREIPSRMLYFPNENHWTLNPFNSLVWHQEIFDWMQFWTN
ncbi:unnamed protein product [Rotaria socialis]